MVQDGVYDMCPGVDGIARLLRLAYE